jgi:hypothetical protein
MDSCADIPKKFPLNALHSGGGARVIGKKRGRKEIMEERQRITVAATFLV